ncbi:uncharacterized protein LOC121730995 [Aricia agestis]|uniref:uncharacterized protein LOC121730995 n=1 Tax=Aricia agestis TaxID=91739 RepID=UPI001C205920|nr:uncharacterized protein LOC121730995 [Aricia agestis]
MTARQYPQNWTTFERILENGDKLTFVVEDIPESYWEDAVEFMLGNYIREDVWWTTAGTAKEPLAVEEYRVLLRNIVKQRMSLACFLVDGDRTLVGVNMCMPQERDRFVEHIPPKSTAGQLSLRMFSEAMKVTAIYEQYHVDKYLMGAGLSVLPEYRTLGIAVEMLKCRVSLAKELGFAVTGGIFTSASAQRAAEKAAMDCVYQISYKEFGEQCEINFDTSTESLKFFAKKTD